jgi:type I restriction enzyme, S subunit
LYQALAADPGVWAPYEAEGTVFGSINKAQLAAIRVAWPSPYEERQLEGVLAALDQCVLSTERECRTLKALRDTLLPRLLSGELRVREVEEPAGEAL